MRVDDLIILVLKYAKPDKEIKGKTLLQKTIYFINEKLDLGIDFTPYYYGPYSTQISEAIESLKAMEIIQENVTFFPSSESYFEPKLYTYTLTPRGDKLSALVENKHKISAEEIKKILEELEQKSNNDCRLLSISAKMYHILTVENKPMEINEIMEEAKFLDWKITEQEAKNAFNFLKNIGLIEEDKDKIPA